MRSLSLLYARESESRAGTLACVLVPAEDVHFCDGAGGLRGHWEPKRTQEVKRWVPLATVYGLKAKSSIKNTKANLWTFSQHLTQLEGPAAPSCFPPR